MTWQYTIVGGRNKSFLQLKIQGNNDFITFALLFEEKFSVFITYYLFSFLNKFHQQL